MSLPQILCRTQARTPFALSLHLRSVSARSPCSRQCIHPSRAPPAPTILITGTRLYGTKAKSTSSSTLIPGSQQRLTSEIARQEYERAEEKMRASVDWFQRECATGQARVSGRVTPALLDRVRVLLPDEENVSRPVPLEEVAMVGVRDGTTLVVTVFDDDTLKHVETAIYDAKLPHISPQRLDRRTLRIPVPKPTMETRVALYTSAQKQAEDTRVQIRKTHHASVKRGKFVKHSVEHDEFQKLVDRYVGEVDKALSQMKKAMGVR